MDNNPFLRLLGVEIVAWQPDLVELRCELKPELLNRSGALQGGVLATLIDAACGYSGLYCGEADQPRHAVTITLAVNYLRKVSSGRLRAVGKRHGGGRKVFFARGEVFDADGNLVASGQTAHKYA
ncbi:MAG: PaaI family thioesterase [Pseudomonadota bacterium]